MRHFHRTHVTPAEVMGAADEFFARLGMRTTSSGDRMRTFEGIVGTPEVAASARLTVKPEGGHYTFVQVDTDQIGESRLDRNVKRFFVELHRRAEPAHRLEASY
jgi:hypothetical protein